MVPSLNWPVVTGIAVLIAIVATIAATIVRETVRDYRNGNIYREGKELRSKNDAGWMAGCLSEEGCGVFCFLGLAFCGLPLYMLLKLNLYLSILIGFIAAAVLFYILKVAAHLLILFVIHLVDAGVIK